MDTIQSYVYRGQNPKPMAQPPPKRISTIAGHRLTTVLENDAAEPGGPQSPTTPQNWPLTNQPSHRSSHHGLPPHHAEEKRPPSYATQDGRGGAAGFWNSRADDEKPPGLLRRVADRRGGWKRLALIISAIVIVLIIALAVGLGVGLSKTSSKTSSSDNTSTSPSTPTGPFPIGAYANTAFLTSISTACTTNVDTWSCYPYRTYTTDASGSEAPFPWIITKDSSKSSQYLISSANNTLSNIFFSNASLTLRDEGTSTERYTFSVGGLLKNIIPSVSLTSDGNIATCFYNSTTLNGSLYTNMNATLTDSSGAQPDAVAMQSKSSSSSGVAFSKAWPGAIRVEQVVDAGSNVPNCYRLKNGVASGERIDIPAASSGQCSCLYMDYGNGEGGS